MSLRHKLVLLLSGLTLAAVVLAVAAAWGEVRQSARLTAEERLSRAVEQLAALANTSTRARRQVQEEVARRPALRRALSGGPFDTAAVAEALAELRTAADSALPVVLVDRDGRTVFADCAPADTVLRPAPRLDTAPAFSGIRDRGEEVHYWSSTPVRGTAGDVLGWAVQVRSLGASAAGEQLEDLIGPGSRVLLALPDEPVAMALGGGTVRLPQAPLGTDTLLTLTHDGTHFLARAGSVDGSAWMVVVEAPAATVAARATAFLRRMSVLALLLVLGTVLVAYALGRRLTDPIQELVLATEAMARGDYSGEVTSGGGGDELNRLARSFNEMAARVAASHRQLQERLAEERELARRLEESTAAAEEAREDAQRANRAKGEFLATMSHEVRTPINAILGYCDLLELEISGKLTDEQRKKVDRIRRSSRILGALVEDVLDFARLDSGRLRLEATTAPVEDAIAGACAVVEPQAGREGLPIRVQVEPGLRYHGDPRRVEQILVNLLSNAVKFTDVGRIEVRAAAAEAGLPPGHGWPTPPGGWVRLDVEDTGPGIPEEHLERVFEPFVQGETGFTRRHGGTGLGLSISRELARMMGGELTLRSRAGEGSCFTLWLPGEAAAAVEAPRSRLA